MRNKTIYATIIGIFSFLVMAPTALAHVIVQPNQVGVATFQTFTIGVPNEKETSVTALKLLLPDGLKSVSPNVKPGWEINVKKEGDGEDAKVTEIDWTGGSIPSGQRDDFLFSAQVPADTTTLQWKAYQTYADGTQVSWDQKPQANMSDDDREAMEKKGLGPYSETKIVNDLKNQAMTDKNSMDKSNPKKDFATQFSMIAFALSAVALMVALRKNKN